MLKNARNLIQRFLKSKSYLYSNPSIKKFLRNYSYFKKHKDQNIQTESLGNIVRSRTIWKSTNVLILLHQHPKRAHQNYVCLCRSISFPQVFDGPKIYFKRAMKNKCNKHQNLQSQNTKTDQSPEIFWNVFRHAAHALLP